MVRTFAHSAKDTSKSGEIADSPTGGDVENEKSALPDKGPSGSSIAPDSGTIEDNASATVNNLPSGGPSLDSAEAITSIDVPPTDKRALLAHETETFAAETSSIKSESSGEDERKNFANLVGSLTDTY